MKDPGTAKPLRQSKLGHRGGELRGGPAHPDSRIHTDAACWFIPAEPLRRLAFKHEEVGEAIHRHICAKFRNLVGVLEGMCLHSVPERVAGACWITIVSGPELPQPSVRG